MGLARWEDLTNQQTRFLAFDSTKLYRKSTTTESFDSGTSGTFGTRLTSWANYRGKLYLMFDNGGGSPSAAAVYDGTNISPAPFNTTLYSRGVVSYIDRLFFLYPRLQIVNHGDGNLFNYTSSVYDFAAAGGWTLSNITASNIVTNGVTVCRLYPTSTTASTAQLVQTIGVFTYTGLAGPIPAITPFDATRYVVWRCDVRNGHATYDMPLTLEWSLVTSWEGTKAYVIGDLISDGTYLQRCTAAGTSGGIAPAWATTVGAVTADAGTLRWTNEGLDVIGSTPYILPNATAAPEWTTLFVTANVPQCTNNAYISPRLKMFNAAIPTITLAPIEISLRDGLADGDPAKRNYGQQFTTGDYFYPFVNTESTASATVNIEDLVWSETAQPNRIRAANTYKLREVAGLLTGGTVLKGRLVTFKRTGFWIFKGTEDPDNPVLPETPARVGIGSLSPVSLDVLDDELFWIAENECYRMKLGSEPVPFCGDSMREEIMSRGVNWVESQSTYNLPILSIDSKNSEVYVYTQKGKLYIYNLASEAWSVCDIQSREVAGMLFNPVTGKMQISLGGKGLIRLDDTVTSKDTIDNTATQYPVSKDITLRPFELTYPRAELCLHDVGVYHLVTASQSAEVLYCYTSVDRGATFSRFVEVRFDTAVPRIPFSMYQFGLTVLPKISHVGSAGRAAWSLSKAEALVELLTGEWPWIQPTQIAASL